jgi:aspartyl-tRNA(Asn)/glutamyl-tRNA(Gln) amidotransferase subunit A
MENDPLKMYLSDILTVGANLAGIPAGVVPVGKTCGLQIIGDYFEEKKILNTMYALERKL